MTSTPHAPTPFVAGEPVSSQTPLAGDSGLGEGELGAWREPRAPSAKATLEALQKAFGAHTTLADILMAYEQDWAPDIAKIELAFQANAAP